VAATPPQIRASYAKLAIRTVKRLPEPDRDRALAAIGEPLRAEIRAAGLFAWLDAERFLALVRAIDASLGRAGAIVTWQQNLRESLERPLLTPLRVGALALYGRHPKSLLRMAPQAWGLVTRGCGAPALDELAPGRLRLRFSGLPAPLCACPELLELWEGGATACAEYVGYRATVVGRDDRLAHGIAEIEICWEES
jgi:hypothetical protein